MSLVEQALLALDTPARAVLGEDLPLMGPDVTVEHLLSHRSGIGDYLDEDVLTDVAAYVLPVPTHRLVRTEDFLPVPAGFPADVLHLPVLATGDGGIHTTAGDLHRFWWALFAGRRSAGASGGRGRRRLVPQPARPRDRADVDGHRQRRRRRLAGGRTTAGRGGAKSRHRHRRPVILR